MKRSTQYPSLDKITAPLVTTDAAAHYLLRQPETLRVWAQASPEQSVPVRPIRIGARLGWPVDQIRAACGVA